MFVGSTNAASDGKSGIANDSHRTAPAEEDREVMAKAVVLVMITSISIVRLVSKGVCCPNAPEARPATTKVTTRATKATTMTTTMATMGDGDI